MRQDFARGRADTARVLADLAAERGHCVDTLPRLNEPEIGLALGDAPNRWGEGIEGDTEGDGFGDSHDTIPLYPLMEPSDGIGDGRNETHHVHTDISDLGLAGDGYGGGESTPPGTGSGHQPGAQSYFDAGVHGRPR